MNTHSNASTFKNKHYRQHINSKILSFNQAFEKTGSQRAAAKLTDIPCSSARYHQQRQKSCDMDEEVNTFFRTPSGMTLLHQLSLAAEFVFTQVGDSGIRQVQLFYELSQLDRFVSCSLGSLQKRIETQENALIQFGEQQESKLVKTMPVKDITCCLDETFPSGICLVAIEPVSNFIILEEMAEKRDSATWKQAMSKRLDVLPVNVIQVTSDCATALIKYAGQSLKANHSPDLFHVQQDIGKGTSAPLRSKLKSLKKTVEKYTLKLESRQHEKQTYEDIEKKPVGRRVDHEAAVIEAEIDYEGAVTDYESAKQRCEDVRESKKMLGDIYHPFDMATGKKQTAYKLRRRLDQTFDDIEISVEGAELNESSDQYIKKARKMIAPLVSTLALFWTRVEERIASLHLSKELKSVFLTLLLPAIYFEIHASKARLAEEKRDKLDLSTSFYDRLRSHAIWKSLPERDKANLIKQAKDCAHFFQRSSSNVEGRNGYLSLYHHVYKMMNPRKMQASTIIHNYFVTREDRTTAAERFFGSPPDDLFSWLLANTDYPALPAKKRMPVQKLNCAA